MKRREPRRPMAAMAAQAKVWRSVVASDSLAAHRSAGWNAGRHGVAPFSLTERVARARWRFRVSNEAWVFRAPVAQLDRASDFESAGRPFESDRARFESQRAP